MYVFFLKKFAQENIPRDKAQIFYYGRYGNQTVDGSLQHWNHEIVPHWNNLGPYKGDDDIGRNFILLSPKRHAILHMKTMEKIHGCTLKKPNV